MRVIKLSPEVERRIAEQVKYALAHVVDNARLKRIAQDEEKAVGDTDSMHTLDIPFGFHVVFSIDETDRGHVRHISISVDSGGDSMPHPVAVNVILPLYGFKNRIEKPLPDRRMFHVWIENSPIGKAVNVIELLEEK